jgi:hypothetical protein
MYIAGKIMDISFLCDLMFLYSIVVDTYVDGLTWQSNNVFQNKQDYFLVIQPHH